MYDYVSLIFNEQGGQVYWSLYAPLGTPIPEVGEIVVLKPRGYNEGESWLYKVLNRSYMYYGEGKDKNWVGHMPIVRCRVSIEVERLHGMG